MSCASANLVAGEAFVVALQLWHSAISSIQGEPLEASRVGNEGQPALGVFLRIRSVAPGITLPSRILHGVIHRAPLLSNKARRWPCGRRPSQSI